MDIDTKIFDLIKSGKWVINIRYTKEGYYIEKKIKKEFVKDEEIFTGIGCGDKLMDHLYVCDGPCMYKESDGTRKFLIPPYHPRCTFLILPGQLFYKGCENSGLPDYRIILKNLTTKKLF